MKSLISLAILGAAALVSAVSAKPVLQARTEDKYSCDYDWHKGGYYKDDSVIVIDDADFPKKLQYYGDWKHKSYVPDFYKKTVSDTCDGCAYVATELPKGFDTLYIFGDKCTLGGKFDIFLGDYWVAEGDEYTDDKYDGEKGEFILAVDFGPTLEKLYPKKEEEKKDEYKKDEHKKDEYKKDEYKKDEYKKDEYKKDEGKKEYKRDGYEHKEEKPKEEKHKEEPLYIIIRNRPFDFRLGGFGYAPKLSLDKLVLVDTDKCKEYKDYY